MSKNPKLWDFVRQHASGFYINFINLLGLGPSDFYLLSSEMTHKDAYYESDSRNTGLGGFPDGGQFSRSLERHELEALLRGGFTVPYASLNYGVDSDKLSDLEHIGMPANKIRPVLTQCGPWTISGDILSSNPEATYMRKCMAHTAGMSTDGPLSLWLANQGQMQQGSFSIVKYAHTLHKLAAVMVTPYNLDPLSLWLKTAQQCVRQHEDADASPDMWIVFEYATSTPTLPETDASGHPADTITGMAYWLLHHLDDPQHDDTLEVINQKQAVDSTAGYKRSEVIRIPFKNASAHNSIRLVLHNSSVSMDYCPTLSTKIIGNIAAWNLRFFLNHEDVTASITGKKSLPFIGTLRMWPQKSQSLMIKYSRNTYVLTKHSQPPVVEIVMHANSCPNAAVEQMITLRPELVH